MKPIHILGLLVFFTLTFWAGMQCQRAMTSLESIGEPSFKREHLYFAKLDTSIYIKSRTWGLTGNHSLTVISLDESKEFFPDSLTEYIFDGSKLFYRRTKDSLIVYYYSISSHPSQFNTNVSLKFKEIDIQTYYMMDEEVRTGLRKFE